MKHNKVPRNKLITTAGVSTFYQLFQEAEVFGIGEKCQNENQTRKNREKTPPTNMAVVMIA